MGVLNILEYFEKEGNINIFELNKSIRLILLRKYQLEFYHIKKNNLTMKIYNLILKHNGVLGLPEKINTIREKLKTEYDRLASEQGVDSSNVVIDYLAEEVKIEEGQFDIGAIYEDAQGNPAKYMGKDQFGKDIWEPVK